MYTYERLIGACRSEDNDSAIAHYLLNHLHALDKLTLSKMVNETGISKASIHRFYSKGGYVSFKDMTSTLNNEIKQRSLQNIQYETYKMKMVAMFADIHFNEKQIKSLIDAIKKAPRVMFYGSSLSVMSMKNLQFYMFMNHIKVEFLDRWDLNSSYHAIKMMEEDDVFIMVEPSWRIQSIYEYSMNNLHMLNLDTVNDMPFQKFYIGEANCEKYLSWQNIKVLHDYNDISLLSLDLLDHKIGQML